MRLLRRGNGRFHNGLTVRTHGVGGILNVEDANGCVAGIGASPFFDIRELGRSGAAPKTELCSHPFARCRERLSTAGYKFRDGHLLALLKVFKNDSGRRIALFRHSVRKLNRENYFGHLRRRRQTAFQRWSKWSRRRISRNRPLRCRKSSQLRSAIDRPARAHSA